MTNDNIKIEDSYDNTVPIALFLIEDLRRFMKHAVTDSDKHEAVCRCLTDYLAMSAGRHTEGLKLLTDFVLSEFTPYTESQIPPEQHDSEFGKHRLTDTIAAERRPSPNDHLDLFVVDADAVELIKELEENGLLPPEKENTGKAGGPVDNGFVSSDHLRFDELKRCTNSPIAYCEFLRNLSADNSDQTRIRAFQQALLCLLTLISESPYTDESVTVLQVYLLTEFEPLTAAANEDGSYSIAGERREWLFLKPLKNLSPIKEVSQ